MTEETEHCSLSRARGVYAQVHLHLRMYIYLYNIYVQVYKWQVYSLLSERVM